MPLNKSKVIERKLNAITEVYTKYREKTGNTSLVYKDITIEGGIR